MSLSLILTRDRHLSRFQQKASADNISKNHHKYGTIQHKWSTEYLCDSFTHKMDNESYFKEILPIMAVFLQ